MNTPGEEAFALRLHSGAPAALLDRLSEAGYERPAVALAETLAASPPAATLEGVVLAVREQPLPALLFFGAVDEAGRARLAELTGLIDEASVRLRLLAWNDVERLTASLARRLIDRLGPEAIRSSTLVGIPRGGGIVAGLLAYALNIPRHRVGGRDVGSDGLVILVDDCVLSGARLRSTIADTLSRELVVATLCAHPGLRVAVEASEPRVKAVVSGGDLHDHADGLLGDAADSWRAAWVARGPERYHTALLDLVVFPWSEPQLRFISRATGALEQNWWLGPPASCWAHRWSPRRLPIQVADDSPGTARLAAHVLPVRGNDQLVLVCTRTLTGVTLVRTSLELWDAWVRVDSIPDAAAAVAGRYNVSTERVRSDLEGLLARLAGRGYLVDDV